MGLLPTQPGGGGGHRASSGRVPSAGRGCRCVGGGQQPCPAAPLPAARLVSSPTPPPPRQGSRGSRWPLRTNTSEKSFP